MWTLNDWQAPRQIAYLAAAAKWEGSSTVVLTGGAIVSDAPIEQLYENDTSLPFAVVRPASSVTPSREHGEIDSLARFEVEIACQAFNDFASSPKGALLGDLTKGQTQSTGRSLTQLAAPIRKALSLQKDTTNALVTKVLRDDIRRKALAGKTTLAIVKLIVEVHNLARDRFYGDPYKLAATGGSGTISGTVAQPPACFDLVGLVVVRSAKDATTPPATPGDGTTISSGYSATSFSVSGLAAGAYWVTAFGAHDELNTTPTTPNRYGLGVSQQVTVT